MKKLLLVLPLFLLFCLTATCENKAAIEEREKPKAQMKVGELPGKSTPRQVLIGHWQGGLEQTGDEGHHIYYSKSTVWRVEPGHAPVKLSYEVVEENTEEFWLKQCLTTEENTKIYSRITFSPDRTQMSATTVPDLTKNLPPGLPEAVRSQISGLRLPLTTVYKRIDNTTSPGKPPKYGTIQEAALKGDLRDVLRHLDWGTAINEKDKSLGATALHGAALNGHKDVAELLISKGADVDAETGLIPTPLILACQNGHKDVAELLILHGADVNARDKAGDTPLSKAMRAGNKDLVELLIAKGADVNAKLRTGITLLQYATNADLQEMIKILEKHGAKK